MAKSKDTPNTPPATNAAAPLVDEAQSKAEALRKANADAVQMLGNYFGGERWSKLLQRAQRSGMSVEGITALAGQMIQTRKAHHPRNERAALIGAALGFMCAIGMSPSAQETQSFESALAATAV